MFFFLYQKSLLVFHLFNLLLEQLNSFSSDAYLTHHWPFDNGQLTDVVGGATLTQGSPSTVFIADRFGNPNCALNLNNGFANVPSTYFYFNTPQYSVSVWVKPDSAVGQWARLFECLTNGLKAFINTNPLSIPYFISV